MLLKFVYVEKSKRKNMYMYQDIFNSNFKGQGPYINSKIAANWKMLGKFNFLCSFHIWVSFLKIYGFSDFNKF